MTEPTWLSIKEYAQRYGVHKNTVRKWIEAGLVTVWRKRRTIRIQDDRSHNHSGK